MSNSSIVTVAAKLSICLLTPSKVTHYLNVAQTSLLRSMELPEKLASEGQVPDDVKEALELAQMANQNLVNTMTSWKERRESEMVAEASAARAAKAAERDAKRQAKSVQAPVTSAPVLLHATVDGPEGPALG